MKYQPIITDLEIKILLYYKTGWTEEELKSWNKYVTKHNIWWEKEMKENYTKMDTKRQVLDFAEEKQRLALAGREPPTDENWLKDLANGSVFVAQDKIGDDARKLNLKRYIVVQHFESASILRHFIPDGRYIEIDVPTLDFSRFMKLIDVYFVVTEINEEEGQNNVPTEEPSAPVAPEASGATEGSQ